MIRRTLIAALALTLALPTAAGAGEEKKKDEKQDVGQYVDILPLGLPIVSGGQLVNYVFVYVRINLTPQANAAKLREKEPYFRDALVRAGHRTPFTNPKDLSTVDVPKLVAAMNRDAAQIAGPGQISSIVVTKQAARRRIGTART